MNRSGLPYLSYYSPLLPRQKDREPVDPRDGNVRVGEDQPDYFLDGKRAAPFFRVWTPRPNDAGGKLVPCTPQTCRRWVEAGLAYATAVDDISAELTAAHRRAASVPWWKPLAARRALLDWEEARGRYERVVREAAEAYEPVGREIRQAVQAEKDRAAERAGEAARQKAEAYRRRAGLAERALWGWSMVPSSRTAYVFRHDVTPTGPLASASRQECPRLDLPGLRQALKDLDPAAQPQFDSAALAETERELEGVSFARWWRDLFYEDYRTFTSPPPPPNRSSTHRGNQTGGTGTGGTGGFTGGFSCGGGY